MQYYASLVTKIKCDLFSPLIPMLLYTYYDISNILLVPVIIFLDCLIDTSTVKGKETIGFCLFVCFFSDNVIDSTNEI